MANGAARPIRLVKGLDIPIDGEPEQVITDGRGLTAVALLGGDCPGLRPVMHVDEGDRIRLGQPLFADRRRPEIVFTSPGSGIVRQINRGARRALLSVVVELAGDDEEIFNSWSVEQLANLRRDQVTDTLLVSGQWTALRTRPYGKVPEPKTVPSSIFVTAMDSNPLTAKAGVIVDAYQKDFANGLTVVSRLTDGRVFVCQEPKASLPLGAADNVVPVEFSGPHPSGLVGTHIHFLDPVSARKTVWHLGYQDVIAFGKLFTTGKLAVERVVALAGPAVKRPRLIRTRLGANIDDLTQGELHDVNCRVVSGSLLSGHHARGAVGYLGRFHNQVSVIAEERSEPRRKWFFAHSKKAFSSYSLATPRRSGRRRIALTTGLNGEATALVPLGGYERVMPFDILPTPLLRALLVGDTDTAQALGCLELDEEDLALCTFVCPSKIEYGPLLRASLVQIEKEN